MDSFIHTRSKTVRTPPPSPVWSFELRTARTKSNFKVNFQAGSWEELNELPEEVSFECEEVKNAIDYFKYFFTDEMVDLIIDQTNLYRLTKDPNSDEISKDTIIKFIAIELVMGHCKMPSYVDYWSKTWGYEPIKRLMSRAKYKLVRRFLHFADNSSIPDNDGFYKVRSLSNLLIKQCNMVEN